MDIKAEKIELIKQLLNTDDIGVINSLKSILGLSLQKNQDWGDLPDDVIVDVKDALQEVQAGQTISHTEARETYKKWL